MNRLRREKLKEYIEAKGIVTVGQLTELFPDVSLMTIHRDLNFLQEQGWIEKIRGGARFFHSAAEGDFSARETVNRKAKERIAEKAASLLGDSGSVFLDAGTTIMALAQIFPDRRLGVVTTGPNIALELARRQEPTITLCGGNLNKSNLTLSGIAAEDTVSGLNIDMAFLAASGYYHKAGFTCGMESEARIKALVIEKARTVVMLVDSSKLNSLLPHTFAHLADIDYLITELDPGALPGELSAAAKGVAIL